ncbi:MAG: asparagine synthase (glutamine-hydrolyzing) [Candidatus Omnitrophica bacterium]|nr:asparagine synthase (glutamine-hydrolyzing) [Candidatus Omnitrophota bacterium]
MCGICGQFNFTKSHKIDLPTLKAMVAIMRHRGPDEFGFYHDSDIGLGHARLSIIDITGGKQPIHNEDESVWITYNGEVFNYIELREELEKKGHKFYTHCDTEVLVHLYEEHGPDFVKRLNGQWAFAIWDKAKKQLMLSRDRVGIRPLFYTVVDGSLIFGSEIKSIFMDNRVERAIDPSGLAQMFTLWSNIGSQTVFKGINELPPAHFLLAKDGDIKIERYWDIDFSRMDAPKENISEDEYAEQLLDLLKDAARLRLRADVPVAAYLSGGLDSSFITALVTKHFNNHLKTFSVAFEDKDYDESGFQHKMQSCLGTEHKEIRCSYSDIGEVMPEVIWHTEKPLIRTAPAPLFMLSKLVRDNNMKVVLTGEGADEILAGYDIFREMKIRRFWAKFPDSKIRPELFSSLYNYLPNWPKKVNPFLKAFYMKDLLDVKNPVYSHLPKWKTSSSIVDYFSEHNKASLGNAHNIDNVEGYLPKGFDSFDDLSKAQYLEIVTLLSGNLLNSQGDRVMLGHSVEGRFPFLDYRVMEFCAKLPTKMRLNLMNEKYLLKKISKNYVPNDIIKRKKQGYRSPDSASFFNNDKLEYIKDILSSENIKQTGYFDAKAVENLIKKCTIADTSKISAKHNMAIVGIITTLILHEKFVKNFGLDN